MTYLFVFVFLFCIGAYFFYKPESVLYGYALCVVFFVLVYLAGMRYEIGVDYFAYVDHFEHDVDLFELVKNGWGKSKYEPGYVVFTSIIKIFTDEPQWLFLVSSIVCTSLLFYALGRLTDKRHFFLSIAVYFAFVYLLQEMHVLRQAIAASISYVAWVYFIKRKYFAFIVSFVLVILFHNSALALLPCFLLSRIRFSVKSQIVFVALSSIVFMGQIHWISGLSNIMSSIFPSLASVMKFATYVDVSDRSRSVFVLYFVYLFVFFFILYKNYLGQINIEKEDKCLVTKNIFFFFLIVTSIFWEIDYISTRLGWFLLVGFSIVFPFILDSLYYFRPVFALLFCFVVCSIPVRHFVIPDDTTMMFSPYEDYLQCKILEFECTGRKRAIEYAYRVNSFFRY